MFLSAQSYSSGYGRGLVLRFSWGQLVLSAGINANQYRETDDKIDSHFQINWLGQFYAVNLLYPLIRKTSKLPDTPAPRIVWEASELHRTSPSDVKFESVAEINNPDFGRAALYARTKLAVILGVDFGLVQKVIKPNHDDVYALSVHPGAVCMSFFSNHT